MQVSVGHTNLSTTVSNFPEDVYEILCKIGWISVAQSWISFLSESNSGVVNELVLHTCRDKCLNSFRLVNRNGEFVKKKKNQSRPKIKHPVLEPIVCK